MKKKTKNQFLLFLAVSLFFATAFFTVVYSGIYNVGATDGHIKPVEWVLKKTMENSVSHHAKKIQVPDSINLWSPLYARDFYGHYNAACQTCHGAPGKKADPWMIIYP